MPRVKKSDRLAVSTMLAERGLNPAEALCSIVMDEMQLTDDEADHESVRCLLGGDYELVPSGHPERPWLLRCRAKLRASILGDLLGFCSPKLRSVESTSTHDHRLEIVIRNYSDQPKLEAPKVIEAVAVEQLEDIPERRPRGPRTRTPDMELTDDA